MLTKGPWTVGVSTDRFGWENYTINGGAIHTDDKRQANARLIASAPELLEALDEIKTKALRGNPSITELIVIAANATRKAKGD